MLSIDIKWLVPAVFLSSDRLLNFHIAKPSSNITFEDNKLYGECHSAILDFQPYLAAPLRKEDIKYALEAWEIQEDTQSIDLNNVLNKLKSHFLQWCGDRFEVKPECLGEWLSLLAFVDPAWVIGYGYVELLQSNIFGRHQLIELVSNQCSSALPKRFDGKPVADNHVHLGGHGHNSLSLLDISLYLTKKPSLSEQKWPHRQESSLFNSGQLKFNHLPVMLNHLCKRIVFLTFDLENNLSANSTSWQLLDMYPLDHDLISMLEIKSAKTAAQELFIASHLADTGEPQRWLCFAIAAVLQTSKKSTIDYKNHVTAFIQASNVMRKFMIVSGVGLGNFVDYFGFKLRKPTNNSKTYAAHSLVNDFSESTYREFRGSPNLVIKEKWKGTRANLKLRPKELSEFANELITKKLDLRSHFVIHFTRGFNKSTKKQDNYARNFREHLLKQVRKLQDFFGSAYFGDLNINSTDLQHEQKNIDLRALVRGFDVAGNENEIKIEVFAPTLRVLRSAKHESHSIFDKRLRQPFLTLHSGEDYSHLISGIRAIDEAVTFCEFKAGDRLGHALALGVDVNLWSQRQGRVYISIGEHLDNLVWIYSHALEVINQCPELNSTLPLIDNKIKRWASYLYGKDNNYSTHEMHKAWLLRRNCPLMHDLPNSAVGTEWELWAPDLAYIEQRKHSGSKSVELWETYLNTGIDNQSSYSKNKDKVISVCFSDEIVHSRDELEDFTSTSELQLITAIQDLLIEKYNKKQLIIEACPTSNIYIGRLNSYAEHPIYRWCPPSPEWLQPGNKFNQFGIRKGSMSVCINTDDAGLMPTTIENEHRIIKQTAITEFNVSDFESEKWIDTIRQNGVNIFKSNHLDWVTNQSYE